MRAHKSFLFSESSLVRKIRLKRLLALYEKYGTLSIYVNEKLIVQVKNKEDEDIVDMYARVRECMSKDRTHIVLHMNE